MSKTVVTVNSDIDDNLPDDLLHDIPQSAQEQAAEEVLLNQPIGEIVDDPAANSLEQKLADAENRALRAYADLDNYKKRFEREIARQRDVERERFLTGILSVNDNLRRALNVQGSESSPYREGLLTVMRQIDAILRDFGVELIAAEKGQMMDPNVHEALTTMNVPGAEHESIIEVVEPGYKIGDRVLRPARVVVAKTDE